MEDPASPGVTRAPTTRAGLDEALPTGVTKTQMVRAMFDAIAPRYDLCNRVMTLGMDQGWRRQAIGMLELAPGSTVLDLGCGTADLVAMLQGSEYRALGADLSFGMLSSAHHGRGVLVQADGLQLPFAEGSIDGLVSGFAVRNFTDLHAVLAEAARVLRRGGRISLLEVDTPASPLLRLGHKVWFERVVPRIGAALSDAAAYRYLPRSVAYLPSIKDLRSMLHEAGFEQVERRRLSGGIVQIVTATCRRPMMGTSAPTPS